MSERCPSLRKIPFMGETCMPDLDIIDSSVRPGWRPASPLFKGTAEPEEFARAANVALAKGLREHGGLPGAEGWFSLLRDRQSGQLDPHSAFTRARALEHQYGHHRHAKVAQRVASELLVQVGQGDRIGRDLPVVFCERFCGALSDNLFFGPIRPHLIGKHFTTRKQAQSRERDCREALKPFVERLGRTLAVRLDGEGVRAPAIRRASKRTTEELLHLSIT